LTRHKFAIDDKEYEVEVGTRQDNRVQVTVNGKPYDVELRPNAAPVPVARASYPPPAPTAAPRPTSGASAADAVRAPMAGLVLSIKCKVGDQVNAGDELLMLEAMKMENAITAHRSGVVKRIAVEPHQVVNQDDVLLELG
jgi:glutaconyl-CoA/methylmalonyl-CoA decarboxylase subunit gamma